MALGHPGNIERIVVDTAHFKGNYPDSCSIQAAYVKGGTDDQVETQSLFWRELLPAQKLQAHEIHEFISEHLIATYGYSAQADTLPFPKLVA